MLVAASEIWVREILLEHMVKKKKISGIQFFNLKWER